MSKIMFGHKYIITHPCIKLPKKNVGKSKTVINGKLVIRDKEKLKHNGVF